MNIFGCGRDTSFDFLDRGVSSAEWEERRLHELHVRSAEEERRNFERELNAQQRRDMAYLKMEMIEMQHPNHLVFNSREERYKWQKQQERIRAEQIELAYSKYKLLGRIPLFVIIEYFEGDLSKVENWINRPLSQRQWDSDIHWGETTIMVNSKVHDDWMNSKKRLEWFNAK